MAWGIFDTSVSVADALKNGIAIGSDTITGDERSQIKAIAATWSDFYRDCVFGRCMEPEWVEFICEDFIPRLGGKTGKEITSPERIAWGVEGYRMGRADQFRQLRPFAKVHQPPMILQPPSHVSTFATKVRLREWDLWVRGREHERSAFKHIAYRLGVISKQR